MSYVQLVVSNPGPSEKNIERQENSLHEGRVLLVQIPNQAGSLARFAQKLAAKGVDIGAAYQTAADGSKQASVVLAVSHLGMADRVR